MDYLIVLAVLFVVVVVISGPLRRTAHAPTTSNLANGKLIELAELQAARDAKYREIRDAELDHRTGKLSDQDFEAVDRALRAEAVEILRALDRADGAHNGASAHHA
ncbi:MAG: hypothetical protein JO372_06560 [Solirubrobacterales bacterium]|nr:hypothetical protein [Solirubrobacterales bacterium]